MQVHQRLAGNAADVVSLIERGLTRAEDGCSEIALNCYQVSPAWIYPVSRSGN
jgi:hypothetical protein